MVGPGELANRYPGLESFRLKRFMGKDVYEVHDASGTELVDARTGTPLGMLDEAAARELASSLYHGDAQLTSLRLLNQAPKEVATRPVPMWQANFGDRGATTLYLSPQTGELLAKRHNLWRMYDFLWMFHIMDYEKRTNVNNTLLRVASSVGVAFALSGVWLLIYSFRKRKRA